MDVLFGVYWDWIVDNVGYFWNVKFFCCYIGCNEYFSFFGFKVIECFFFSWLVYIVVEGFCFEFSCFKFYREFFCFGFSLIEYYVVKFIRFIWEYFGEKVEFFVGNSFDVFLFNFFWDKFVFVDDDYFGVFYVFFC